MVVHRSSFLIAAGLFMAAGTSALAQDTRPWDLIGDRTSDAQCDVVNADGLQLVVLSETGELVVVTRVDIIIADSLVDDSSRVFIGGEPAGVISFATDGDGARTLWWLDNTGVRVVRIDPFTFEPSASSKTPDDYENVPCDACPFWDLTEPGCEIPTEILTQPRGGRVCVGRDFTLSVEVEGSLIDGFQWFKNGDAIDGATGPSLRLTDVELTDTASYRVDVIEIDGAHVSSSSATVVVDECRLPNIMCGAAASSSMALSVIGLAAMGVRRRR